MPAGRHRSRKLRRIQKRMPGGKTKKVYVKRLSGVHKCAVCKIELKGIPRLDTAKAKNAPKSDKRVARLHGGFLCAHCLKEMLKKEARQGLQ